MDWNNVNWRLLQERCVERNANRYTPINLSQKPPNWSTICSDRGIARRASTIDGQGEPSEEGPEFKAKARSRTALLLRASSSKNYTENDLQNIRSLVTELSLRSGGEYTMYLLVNLREAPLHTEQVEMFLIGGPNEGAPEDLEAMSKLG